MPKSNSSKKNDIKSSEPVEEEKQQQPQEQANIKQPARRDGKRDKITHRQEEVLKLLVQGYTNQEVAKRLEVSVKTIDAHRAAIMMRLQIHDLPGLVKYAIRNGLTSIEE